MKKQGRSYWADQIKNYETGDYKNKAVYCREFNLNYDHFLYWYGRLNAPISNARKLTPVKLKAEDEITKALCSIELSDGRRLWIHDEASVEKLIRQII